MGNPCPDLAPGQPPANMHGIWTPSPATKLAFSGARGSCASSCPLAADKSPGMQRPAKRQRRRSIPIARHHLSGGLAQRDLLTTGRGATPSRAAAWVRRDRQSKDSLHYGELSIATQCGCWRQSLLPHRPQEAPTLNLRLRFTGRNHRLTPTCCYQKNRMSETKCHPAGESHPTAAAHHVTAAYHHVQAVAAINGCSHEQAQTHAATADAQGSAAHKCSMNAAQHSHKAPVATA